LWYDAHMNAFNKVQLIEITADRAGQRVDNYLIKLAKGVPQSRIYRVIRKGEVRVNKKRAKASQKLCEHDVLRIPPLMVSEQPAISMSQSLRDKLLAAICYEDENLLVLNKPAGLAVHGGTDTDFSLILALRSLRENYQQLELAHRLDKYTSGCLLVAKNIQTLRALQQQMRQGQIEKRYTCLVKGNWSSKHRHVRNPLKKQIISGEQMVVVAADGKTAHTEFECLEQFNTAALVSAYLHTGRTHQIRVHLQHIGHPIARDRKYGDKDFNQIMKQLELQRMFLHAEQLKFYLPDSKKAITVTAPLDNELLECLKILRKSQN